MIKDLYWVGIRQSEIEMISNMFDGSVCLFGKIKPNKFVYKHERCNQNIITDKMYNYYLETLKYIIHQNPNCKFMFYNQNKAYSYGNEILEHSICCNSKMLLDNLSDKIWVRKIFSQIVKAVPSIELTITEQNISKSSEIFKNHKKLVIQRPVSGGGTGTFICDPKNCTDIIGNLRKNERVLVSPYIENSYSTNTTLVIGAKNYLIFPSSVQIVEQIDNRFLYRGADYIAFSKLNIELQKKVHYSAEKIAQYLRSLGYCGVIGIDLLIDCNEEVYFVELNNRFQASTDLLNIAISKQNISLQELNLMAFEGKLLPEIDTKINLSSYFYYNEGACDFRDLKSKYEAYTRKFDNDEISDNLKLISDGFDINTPLSNNCYGFKVNFNKQICMPSHDGQLWINENIRFVKPDLYETYKKDLLKLKIALLNQGVYLAEEISVDIKAAVYRSIDLNIDFKGKIVTLNCPYKINFSQTSPFFVDKNLMLKYAGQDLFKIEIDKFGIPTDAKTSSGKQISQIVYMSEDRLRIKTMSGCDFKKNNMGCDFCNNSANCIYFELDDIIESINYATALYGKKLKHFLIGGGTDFRETYWELVERIINYIHLHKELPQGITLMVAPFDTAKLERLKLLNVTDFSVNIEVYDNKLAKRIMKGKGVDRQIYFDFFRKAKEFWSGYGDLRSMIMVGLDKTDNLLKLVAELTPIGVQPVLSIFRPLPKTPMENHIMPPNDYLEKIYYMCLSICQNINPVYSLGPKCSACKNNVLAL